MKGRGFVIAIGLTVCVCVSFAHAQGPAPKPGPEHKKLDYFVGKWTSDGEVKKNDFMPSGKFTSKDDCHWFEGGFTVVCNSEGSGPTGAVRAGRAGTVPRGAEGEVRPQRPVAPDPGHAGPSHRSGRMGACSPNCGSRTWG